MQWPPPYWRRPEGDETVYLAAGTDNLLLALLVDHWE